MIARSRRNRLTEAYRPMPQINQTSLTALAAFPDLLAAAYAAVPSGRKHWRPKSWEGIPSEHLTAIEQVCHVLDIEVGGYHARLRRTLVEDRPVLADLPGERLAEERNYSAADAADVLAKFKAARAETLRTIAALTTEQLDRVAIFENRPTTLRGLVHFLCSHDFQHLAGLQWLLAMMNQAGDES